MSADAAVTVAVLLASFVAAVVWALVRGGYRSDDTLSGRWLKAQERVSYRDTTEFARWRTPEELDAMRRQGNCEDL